MFLSEAVLKSWWKNKDSAFTKKEVLADRFNEIGEIVDLFKVKPSTKEHLVAFGANTNGDTDSSGPGSLTHMKTIDSCAEDMWKLIGGWDGNKFDEKFRIISNSVGCNQNYLEIDSLAFGGSFIARANSNFASNNYPSQIAKFLQECNNGFNIAIDKSKMVLTWQTETYLGKYPTYLTSDLKQSPLSPTSKLIKTYSKYLELLEYYFLESKKRLETRFPPKFLWMWANKETVLHPFSLMAFRNFLNSKFMEDLLKIEISKILNILKENSCTDDFNKFPKDDNNLSELPKLLTDMKFDCFTKVWKHISDAILAKLNPPLDIAELSKLISILMVEETDMKNVSELLCTSKQIILYGAPGTGKTYTAQQVVKEFIKCKKDSEKNPSQKEFDDKQPEFNLEDYNFSKCLSAKSPTQIKPYKTGLYEIIQFHPNYTYQDFIGGISPNVNGGQIAYELKEGIFQRFCKVAEKNPDCNFILIIDEINRANLSEVFGELLYALEYRGKSINIPYFGEFTIPEKVYIIGTMNDVDKSLVTFDLALRRRFGFFELAPNLDTLSNMFMFQIEDNNGKKEICSLVEQNCLELYIKRCKKLNDDIKDKEKGLALEDSYQIGQAYFKKIENFLDKNKPDQLITPFELEKLWLYHLEPLLKEYLGMSLDSNEIKTKLEGVKKAFIVEELK